MSHKFVLMLIVDIILIVPGILFFAFSKIIAKNAMQNRGSFFDILFGDPKIIEKLYEWGFRIGGFVWIVKRVIVLIALIAYKN